MADCFISYKREDRDRVEPIAAALREAGLSVWWDADLVGGARWRDTIVTELDAARCVLVCWTEGSVGPDGGYVREEAERAKRRGVLLPLLLDRVAPPFGFGEVQALDLVGWDGRPSAAAWKTVLKAIQATLAGRPVPPATLRRRRWTRAGGAAAAATALLAGTGLVADLTGLHATLCKPESLRHLCRWVGLGPSVPEQKAWDQARSATTGDVLRAYLGTFPSGTYAAEAQARLAACRTVVGVTWAPHLQRIALVVPMGPLQAAPTEAAARQAMQPEVERGAEDACSAASVSELYRPAAGARPEVPPKGWDCRDSNGGWRCRYDGQVSCPQEKRQSLAREVCPAG